ncbi:MAG: cation:proton antiporter [Armatimonadetes bacterium]|nr:cation:proton antiporter [Armatimonadota bacterium]MDI9601629.1 cation:proton antiporter [Acidobacteriota bacterium]NLN90195.1 hypothetical protein [candidate division WS1 bacterium]
MVPANTDFLSQLITVIGLSLVTVWGLRRLRIPAVVGFLLVGVAFGPGGLGLVADSENIQAMAQIGVLFLLFSAGLEFSLRDLWQMRSWVFGAGGPQVLGTVAILTLLSIPLDLGPRLGVVFGCLIAHSSSSLYAKVLEERGDLNSSHGRFGLSLSLFQDVTIVPMVLVLPVLAGTSTSTAGAVLGLGRAILIVVSVLLAAHFIYPRIVGAVVRSRSRELFALTTVTGALGTAFLVGKAGISLEIGAFLAGAVVSETEYGRETLETVAPLRDVFSGLFFVSIGMLVSPAMWLAEPVLTLGFALFVILGKAVFIVALALLFRLSMESALIAGMGLAQLGEFSFIYAQAAISEGALPEDWYHIFLSTMVLSMTAAPILMLTVPRAAARLRRRALRPEEPFEDVDAMEGHVILVGYGLQGRSVGRVLDQIGVPFIAIEMNPVTVREIRGQGVPIMFGNAGREHVLRHAQVERAKVLVSSVPDPAGSREVVSEARRLNPDLYIIARTRYLGDVEALVDLGANEVVPEEFETAIEMVGLVMQAYGVPPRAVEREQDFIREDQYGLLRRDLPARGRGPSLRSLLSGADVRDVALLPDSLAVGQTLRALDLRAETGVTLLGIERAGELLANPSPDTPLLVGDVLVLFGTGEGVTKATQMLAGAAGAQ